jgi:methyl-accepting chemotaxis protein
MEIKLRLNTSAKVSLTVAAALIVLLSVLIVASATSSLDFAKREAVMQQEANMRVAWDALHQRGARFSREGDRLLLNGIALNGETATVDRVKSLVGGVATIFMGDTRIATNVMKSPGVRAVGTPLAKGPVYDAVLKEGKRYRGQAVVLGAPYFVAYDPIKDASGAVVGILFVGVAKADYFQPVYRQLMGLGLIGLGLAGAGVGVSVLMVRQQLRPLQDIRNAMEKVMSGDLSVALPFSGRPDDMGLMADAVHTFRDDVREKSRIEAESARLSAEAESRDRATDEQRRAREAEQNAVVEALAASLGRLAKGDLTTRIDAKFVGRDAQIKTDFNEAVKSLREAMESISDTTEGIRGGSDEIANASDDLARRTEQQAASLEETAAALDQITGAVKRSAEGAQQVSAAATNAKADAERSGEVVRDAVEAMSGIETSSREISQIIGVIDEIAFQTNLLALNAGVEAARAGDAGRGFAVVASEVRALAQRSAGAAKEIKGLIANSGAHVERGVRLVGETGQALSGIVIKVSEINGLISDIAQSSQQQAGGLNEINAAINQMDQVTQQNAAMVEEATAASANLKSEAAALAELVSRFQIGGREAAHPGLVDLRARRRG